MNDFVWINHDLMRESQAGKTLEEFGRECRDAMIAAAENRPADYPDWMADSVDSGEGEYWK